MKRYILMLCIGLFFGMHADDSIVIHKQAKSPKVVKLDDIGMPKKLEAKIDAGKIVIRTADSGFSCTYRGHKTDMSKTVKVKKGGEKLELEFKKASKSQSFFEYIGSAFDKKEVHTDPHDARVNFDVVLPKNCEIKIKLGSGEIDIAGINGEIKVEAGSATIKAHSISHNAELSLGSGKIDVIYADNKLYTPKKCKIKAGYAQVTLAVPSSFCVKNKIKGAPFASKITNDCEPCAHNPDIIFEGGIGSGSVVIKKK